MERTPPSSARANGDRIEPAEPDGDWQRRLGRIRLGAEPVEQQLARYRRATLVMSGIVVVIALFLLTLFAGFGRPDLGLWVAGIPAVPTLLVAWIDHLRLTSAVAAYRRAHPPPD
jgi:hypothetical protein